MGLWQRCCEGANRAAYAISLMAAQTEWTKILTDNGAPPNVGSSTAVRLKNRETAGERPAAHALRS